jgi:hypothetical protein
MRLTLSVDDDVYEAAKALAQGSGRSLGSVLSDLARKGLQPAEVMRPCGKGEPPTFHVRPGAAVIPGSRAADLLATKGAK